MAQRKFVEDSDEEDEEPETSTLQAPFLDGASSQRVSSNPHCPHAHAAASNNCQPIGLNATATELFDHKPLCTKDDHVLPTPEDIESPVKKLIVSQQTPTATNERRSKRKRALSNLESPSPKVQISWRTNVSDRDEGQLGVHGSSDGEAETSLRSRRTTRKLEWPTNVMDASDRDGVDIFVSHPKAVLPSPSESFALYLSTAADQTTRESLLTGGRARAEHSLRDLRSSAAAALQWLPASNPLGGHSSSDSSVSPSKANKTSNPTTRADKLRYDGLEDELSHSAAFDTAGHLDPIVLLPERPQEQNPPMLNPREAQSSSEDEQTASRHRKRTEVREPKLNKPDPDDDPVEMSKDQYQPRPTRSRANCSSDELVVPTDFSKRPEDVAKAVVTRKRKIKRSKSTSFQELRPVTREEEEREDFLSNGEMGFEKDAHRDESLRLSRKSMPSIVDDEKISEANGGKTDDTVANKPTRKRGRPKKEQRAEDGELDGIVVNECDEEQMIPDEAKNGLQRNSMTKKIMQKETECGPGVLEDDDDAEAGSLNKKPAALDVSTTILVQSTGNATQVQYLKDTLKSNTNPHNSTLPPMTPPKPANAPAKGPDKHSPISSGKVAYRVGLSKRARIEPLLRIVRK